MERKPVAFDLNQEWMELCEAPLYDRFVTKPKRKIYPRSSVVLIAETVFDVIRYVLLVGLALIAVIALTYPPSREELFAIIKDLLDELHIPSIL